MEAMARCDDTNPEITDGFTRKIEDYYIALDADNLFHAFHVTSIAVATKAPEDHVQRG
jgi:hypothetical protein